MKSTFEMKEEKVIGVATLFYHLCLQAKDEPKGGKAKPKHKWDNHKAFRGQEMAE